MSISAIKNHRAFGSFAAIARVCINPKTGRPITRMAVSKWKQVPSRFCIPIEQYTNGDWTRYTLRPDVFGARAVHSAETS